MHLYLCALRSQSLPPWQDSMILGQASPVAHLGAIRSQKINKTCKDRTKRSSDVGEIEIFVMLILPEKEKEC